MRPETQALSEDCNPRILLARMLTDLRPETQALLEDCNPLMRLLEDCRYALALYLPLFAFLSCAMLMRPLWRVQCLGQLPARLRARTQHRTLRGAGAIQGLHLVRGSGLRCQHAQVLWHPWVFKQRSAHLALSRSSARAASTHLDALKPTSPQFVLLRMSRRQRSSSGTYRLNARVTCCCRCWILRVS